MTMKSSTQPIVITGVGVISSIGNGFKQFTHNLLTGVDGIKEIIGLDTSTYRTHHGGEVVTFDPVHYGINLPWEYDPCSLMATCAALEALDDSGLGIKYPRAYPYRTAVAIAVLSGGVDAFEQFVVARHQQQPIDARVTLNTPGRIVQHVALYLGAHGPIITPSTACAASINSVVAGTELLKTNEADMVVAGGVDPITRTTYLGFNALQAVSKGHCKPFDQNRDGIAIGAGSVIFILERLTDALARKAKIYAYITGYGLSNDAHHITAPHPTGRGIIYAMQEALLEAGLQPNQIDYISAHGTGTQHNDAAELTAIEAVFGTYAAHVPISSVKSSVGHTMGTAGAMNILACVIALQEQKIPPTLHLQNPIAGYEEWSLVGGKSIGAHVKNCMANAVAFGGHTASIVIGQP